MKRFTKAIVCTVIAVLVVLIYQLFDKYTHDTNGFIYGSKLYTDKHYNIVDNNEDNTETYKLPTGKSCVDKLIYINKKNKGDAYHATYNKKNKICYIHFIDNLTDNSLGYYNYYKNSIYNNYNIYYHPKATKKQYKNIDTHQECIDKAKKDSAIVSTYDPDTDKCDLLIKGYYDNNTINWTIL